MPKSLLLVLVLLLLAGMCVLPACKKAPEKAPVDSTRVMLSTQMPANPESLYDGKGLADSAQSVIKPPKTGN